MGARRHAREREAVRPPARACTRRVVLGRRRAAMVRMPHGAAAGSAAQRASVGMARAASRTIFMVRRADATVGCTVVGILQPRWARAGRAAAAAAARAKRPRGTRGRGGAITRCDATRPAHGPVRAARRHRADGVAGHGPRRPTTRHARRRHTDSGSTVAADHARAVRALACPSDAPSATHGRAVHCGAHAPEHLLVATRGARPTASDAHTQVGVGGGRAASAGCASAAPLAGHRADDCAPARRPTARPCFACFAARHAGARAMVVAGAPPNTAGAVWRDAGGARQRGCKSAESRAHGAGTAVAAPAAAPSVPAIARDSMWFRKRAEPRRAQRNRRASRRQCPCPACRGACAARCSAPAPSGTRLAVRGLTVLGGKECGARTAGLAPLERPTATNGNALLFFFIFCTCARVVNRANRMQPFRFVSIFFFFGFGLLHGRCPPSLRSFSLSLSLSLSLSHMDVEGGGETRW